MSGYDMARSLRESANGKGLGVDFDCTESSGPGTSNDVIRPGVPVGYELLRSPFVMLHKGPNEDSLLSHKHYVQLVNETHVFHKKRRFPMCWVAQYGLSMNQMILMIVWHQVSCR
jgi:hypothetical protein